MLPPLELCCPELKTNTFIAIQQEHFIEKPQIKVLIDDPTVLKDKINRHDLIWQMNALYKARYRVRWIHEGSINVNKTPEGSQS